MTDAESPMATDPEILQSRIQEEWEALTAAVSRLDEPHFILRDDGEWSVKDILAHIAEGEKFLIANQFLGVPAAEALTFPPDVMGRANPDEVNAILFERNRDKSPADVLSISAETHRRLVSELAKLDADRWKRPTLCFGPTPFPMAQWVIWNTCEHYQEHRRTIEDRRMK